MYNFLFNSMVSDGLEVPCATKVLIMDRTSGGHILQSFRMTSAHAGNWLAKRRGAFTTLRHLDSSMMAHQAFTIDDTRRCVSQGPSRLQRSNLFTNPKPHLFCSSIYPFLLSRDVNYVLIDMEIKSVKTNWCDSLYFAQSVDITSTLVYTASDDLPAWGNDNSKLILSFNEFISFLRLPQIWLTPHRYQGDEKSASCIHPSHTRPPYKSRLYRVGPPQHEESSLGVNARAPRNHIRHEQAASPREFTSAGLRFRRGGS